MLIAEVNGKRVHATKGTKGICPCCKAEVIAKCGEVKIAHWSHKSKKNCDFWHEAETDWHRMWKNYFPQEWQEIIMHDENGEKHIADVCTQNRFILEFQHSPIKPEERLSREKFYKNMNWVVDGTRCKSHCEKFMKGYRNARVCYPITLPSKKKVGYVLQIYADAFPKNWLNSNVPVVFDFNGLNEINEPNDLRQFVFCLLPIKDNLYGYIIQIPIRLFIKGCKSGSWENYVSKQIDKLQKDILHNRQKQEAELRRRIYLNIITPYTRPKYRYRPKFKTRKSPRRL